MAFPGRAIARIVSRAGYIRQKTIVPNSSPADVDSSDREKREERERERVQKSREQLKYTRVSAGARTTCRGGRSQPIRSLCKRAHRPSAQTTL